MNEVSKTGKAFVRGAAIIAAAHILIKLLGALYKIPLDRMILKTTGMGIYNAAYSIYSWMFVVSTAGLPVAISKMVSASKAVGRHREAEKIFRVALTFMCSVGLLGSMILLLGANWFADLLNADAVALSIRALSPSIFFVALMSVYRGYTQGYGNMMPTAVSEVAEAVGKLLLGLILAYLLTKISLPVGAAGAIGGVSCGAALGFLAILLCSRRARRAGRQLAKADAGAHKSAKEIFREIFKTAIPITLGASVFTLTTMIDTAMIFNLLGSIGYSEAEYLSLSGYLGRAVTMFNLAPTVVAALAVSVVPALSAALAVGDADTAKDTAASAMRITVLIALPCAVGLSVLAAPVLSFVYNDANHAFLLNLMGIAVAFVTLVQVTNAILQAYGCVWKPVIFMAIGGAVKVLINFLLISRPEININGAPVGTILCYLTVMVLNLIEIRRISKVRYDAGAFLIKPLLSGLVMGICAYGVYVLLLPVVGGSIALLGAIGVGAVVYFAMMLLLRGILPVDVLLLPKGDLILRIFTKLHWMVEK